MQGLDVLEYNCKQLNFAADHIVTERARELLRLIKQKGSAFRECDAYTPILAIDLACRDKKISTNRSKLKDLAKVSLEKYMQNLNMIKNMLGLKFSSDVNTRDLDLLFGSNLLFDRTEELLENFKRQCNLPPDQYENNKATYIACAFLEAASRQKMSSDSMLRDVLGHVEISSSLYKRARQIFLTAVSAGKSLTSNGKGRQYNVSATDKSGRHHSGGSDRARLSVRSSTENSVEEKSSIINGLKEELKKRNRAEDACGTGSATHPSDIGYLNGPESTGDAALSRLSSKRAMSMAGGIDHFKDNKRSEAIESEQQERRKKRRREIYDAWKGVIVSEKRPRT